MPKDAADQTFAVSTGPLPASRKIHVPGTLHPEIAESFKERGSEIYQPPLP